MERFVKYDETDEVEDEIPQLIEKLNSKDTYVRAAGAEGLKKLVDRREILIISQ